MAEGSISVFNFAYNLESGPLSIIGVSYSMAAFPTLAKLFSEGQKDKFVKHVSLAFRHIIFLSIPVTVLFIVVRAQIVRTVLGSGAFTWNDTRLVAACVALFSISLLAQNANLLFFRAYYAAGRTRTPLLISVGSSIATVIITATLYKLIAIWPAISDTVNGLLKVGDVTGTEVLALPLGFTIGTILNLGLFVYFFDKEFRGLITATKTVFIQGLVASLAAGFVAYDTLLLIGNVIKLDTLTAVFSQGLVAGSVGLVAWVVVLRLLRSEEYEEVLSPLKAKIWKSKVLSPEKVEL
jgi:putative peptidoglycan lipid II flippase